MCKRLSLAVAREQRQTPERWDPAASAGELHADEADHRAAERAQSNDRKIGFCDDRAGQTNKDADQQPDGPSWPRQHYDACQEADGEAVAERAEERGPLIRKRHRQHQQDVDRAECEAANHSEQNPRHSASRYFRKLLNSTTSIVSMP